VLDLGVEQDRAHPPGVVAHGAADVGPEALSQPRHEQLEAAARAAVDVGDGVACFTFTDMDLADQPDELVALACDVVELLVDVRKATSLGED